MSGTNETHDPALRSWVESANAAGTDFPIQNLPLTVFRRRGSDAAPRGGAAIGDQIVDLAALADTGLLEAPIAMTELTLTNGERAEIIVDFAPYSAGTEIILTNSAPAPSSSSSQRAESPRSAPW